MKKLFTAALLVGSSMIASTGANATVVDFNSQVNGNCPGSTSIGGLDFSISNPFLCTWEGGSGAAENGTVHMIVSGTTLNVSATSGEAFDLNAFDSGISWYDASSTRDLSITANLFGGGTSVFDFTIDRSFQTFAAGLTNLASLDFNLVPGGSYIAIDNIDFSISEVPVPGTIALLGLGLVALGYRQRRQAVVA